MANLKLAFRRLFKAPFVTSVAILSLALGIGANAAIFSLFNQMLLRPLPVPAPHELVNLQAPGPKPGSQSCNTGKWGTCNGQKLPTLEICDINPATGLSGEGIPHLLARLTAAR